MLTTIIIVLAIVVLGAHLSDGVRLKQEESILHKLPVDEAHAFYELLRKRVRRVRVLRAITLASLVITLYSLRRRLFPFPQPQAARPAARPTNAEAARALADQRLRAHAARAGLDAAGFRLTGVTGDDRFPWIFEYRWEGQGTQDPVRLYVARDGRVDLHTIAR